VSPTEWYYEPEPLAPRVQIRFECSCPRHSWEEDPEPVLSPYTAAEQLFMALVYAEAGRCNKYLEDLAEAARALPVFAWLRLFRIIRACWIVYRLSTKICKRIDDVREKQDTAYGYMRLDDLL
jgi:hypothetical protein